MGSKIKHRAMEIRFPYKPEEVEEMCKLFSKEEFDFLNTINDDFFNLDIITSNTFFTYLFIDADTLKKLTNLYEKRKISFYVLDVTDNYKLDTNINKQFKRELDEFIANTWTCDDVLDKINEFGIESLTEQDKKILIA